NAGPMLEAARAIQTLVVTEAVRDATIGGRKVKRGQTIALGPDDGLLAAGNDREKTVLDGTAAFAPGFELITLFYGDGADLAEAEAMARRIGTTLSGVEVEVRHGGPPARRCGGPGSSSTSTRSATCSSTYRGATTTCARCERWPSLAGWQTARSFPPRPTSATSASSQVSAAGPSARSHDSRTTPGASTPPGSAGDSSSAACSSGPRSSCRARSSI